MKLPPFGIEISPQNGLLHVAVSGELDIATAPRLDAALQQPEAATGIVLDLTRVSFIDSTGLRVLLQAHDAAQHRGRQLHDPPERHRDAPDLHDRLLATAAQRH